MACLAHVKNAFRFWLVAIALFGLASAAARADLPPASELLALVRANNAQMHLQFAGRLKMSTTEGRIVVPFTLQMEQGTHTYRFTDPEETYTLHLGENASRLEKTTGKGKAQNITGAKLDAPVRGTDITYEDLSLKFLYWNTAKTTGEDNLSTRRCWVVEATPGKTASQYDRVRLWIEKSGGLMKAECYAGGKLARRFEVRSVQKAPGGGYILKTLRIQKMDERGRDRTPTILELDKPPVATAAQ